VRPFESTPIPDPDGQPVGVFGYRPVEYRPRWWLHALLFALTLVTTTILGASFSSNLPPEIGELSLGQILIHPGFLVEGLKFSLPLLFILLCHEMGHYVACRRHGLAATPPFFIPFPFGIGTMGAVIRIKEPIRDSQQLLDVGAAGPIAGFVALLPFLAYGIAASAPAANLPAGGYVVFGEPLVYRLIAALVQPQVAEGQELLIHPTGAAAWFGILVTLLNLLPFAQLDGGHITYAMFGRWHVRSAWPLLVLLVALGFMWPGWWLWAVIVIVIGLRHPRLWDEDRPLDPRRRAVGWLCIAIFVVCFMAQPIQFIP